MSQDPRPTMVVVADDSETQDLSKPESYHGEGVEYVATGGKVGGGGARNIAAEHAIAANPHIDWLFFLDDDDEWSEAKMSCVLSLINEWPEVQFIGTSYTLDKETLDHSVDPSFKVAKISRALLYDNAGISPSSMGMTTELFKKLHGFNTVLAAWQGRNLFARVALTGTLALKIKRRLTYQDQGHGLERISDLRAPRYAAMYESIAKTGYSDSQSQYAQVMVMRAMLKHEIGRRFFSTLGFSKAAFAAGPAAVRHLCRLLALDLYVLFR